MAAVTDNGKKAFLVDFEKRSPRRTSFTAYGDRVELCRRITYGTNSEFGFDYLRDNMTMRRATACSAGHHFAIVDEVDNVLIDEARTPSSSPARQAIWSGTAACPRSQQLKPETSRQRERPRVNLTEVGMVSGGHAGADADGSRSPGDVTPEQARLTGYLEQGFARRPFPPHKDYLVGRQGHHCRRVQQDALCRAARWSEACTRPVEAKQGVRVEPENVTYANITCRTTSAC